MLALPEPAEKERPWTHEVNWYGWAGHDLAARAYRLAGQPSDAAALQLVFHKHTQPKIRLTQKTLGNSTKSVAFRDAWLSTAAQPDRIEHRFLVRADDAETMAMAKQFLHDVGEPSTAEPGVIQVNAEDGMVPPHKWDERVLASGRMLIEADIIELILNPKKS
jgi:hypothetical protein